jgi:hypothetical protein
MMPFEAIAVFASASDSAASIMTGSMKSWRAGMCWWTFALAALCGCVSPSKPVVRIAISVDWEGRDLAPSNLHAYAAFRAAHPSVPLTQFLNAAYFTKRDADSANVREHMLRVIKPHDELGMHIHPWQSLVEASGVEFRTTPTIWGEQHPMRRGKIDSGHEGSVESYTSSEFQAIVAHAKEILAANGFDLGTSFRAGAWLAGPNVRRAIRGEGFLVDTSAPDPMWLDEIDAYALPGMIREVWPGVNQHTQPFTIETSEGSLLEMPDTGALADYITADEMVAHIGAVVDRLDGSDRFAHLGFHQETAARYLPRVTEAVRRIKELHGERVRFETLCESASHVQ